MNVNDDNFISIPYEVLMESLGMMTENGIMATCASVNDANGLVEFSVNYDKSNLVQREVLAEVKGIIRSFMQQFSERYNS